jgi:hypothetical protein
MTASHHDDSELRGTLWRQLVPNCALLSFLAQRSATQFVPLYPASDALIFDDDARNTPSRTRHELIGYLEIIKWKPKNRQESRSLRAPRGDHIESRSRTASIRRWSVWRNRSIGSDSRGLFNSYDEDRSAGANRKAGDRIPTVAARG